jgi:hypothetical protein
MIGVEVEGQKATIILKNFPCGWNKCVFCCFSDESSSDLEEILRVNRGIISKVKEAIDSIRRIVIFNGGSFFELPRSVRAELVTITKEKTVEIETRPEFVSEESISMLLKEMHPSELVIRIGFENISDRIRNGLLNKGIDESEIRRVAKLRTTMSKEGVKFVSYVLFGMRGISEESVMRSVKVFKRLFDGVIAIRYRRYKITMPETVESSRGLMDFLYKNCMEVDLTDSRIWEVELR